MERKTLILSIEYNLKNIKNEDYFNLSIELNELKNNGSLKKLNELKEKVFESLKKQELNLLNKELKYIKQKFLHNINLFDDIQKTKIEKLFKKNSNIYEIKNTIALLNMKVILYIEYIERKNKNNNSIEVKEALKIFNHKFLKSLPYLEKDKVLEIKENLNKQLSGIIDVNVIYNYINEIDIIVALEKDYLKLVEEEDLAYYIERIKEEINEEKIFNDFAIDTKEKLLFLRKYNNQKSLH